MNKLIESCRYELVFSHTDSSGFQPTSRYWYTVTHAVCDKCKVSVSIDSYRGHTGRVLIKKKINMNVWHELIAYILFGDLDMQSLHRLVP